MKKLLEKFPEIKFSEDPSSVPWKDALVWFYEKEGKEKYYWISAEEILYVSWSGGLLSVIPSSSSLLSNYFQAVILQGESVFVGAKIKVSN
ncbi:MAG: hypothetical protein GX447_01085 [Elusimicrobia bacterium]|nr:hypothetical protein [Elusimicrobiota bacterium]